MADARYKVIVDTGQAAGARTFDKLAALSDWKVDKSASDEAPGELSVLTLERSLAPDSVSDGMTAVRAALGVDDLSDAGVEAELAEIRPEDGKPLVRFLAHSGDHFMDLIEAGFRGSGDTKGAQPSGTDGSTPATGTKKDEDKDEDKDESGNGPKPEKKDEPPPATPRGAEATIAAVDAVLGDPDGLWAHLDDARRADLAAAQIPQLYAQRAEFARRSEWALAPELALLELTDDRERPTLASEVLKVRAQLTTEDVRLRGTRADMEAKRVELEGKRVELEGQRVELEKRRVELADEGVETAKELRRHMAKWRDLAGLAPRFLTGTTVFAVVAIGYLLRWEDVGDVALPAAIFALAVFAISPAVLLLLERPLKGMDDWMPGGKPGGSGSGTDSATPATTPATTPAADPKSPS